MKHNFIKDAASFQIFIKFIHEYFLLFKRATKKEGKSSKKNSISKYFYRINNKIRNLGRHLDCDTPTCSSIVSYFARTLLSSLLRSVFRVAIPWRHGEEETRSQRCASRLAKTGNYRVFREVAMRRRNECHPGIMSSITIFM